jgi:hypothetical protein
MLEQLGQRILKLRLLLPWLVALLALSGLLLLKSCGGSSGSSLLTGSGIPSPAPTLTPSGGTPQPAPTASLPPGASPSPSVPPASPDSGVSPPPTGGSTPSIPTPTSTPPISSEPGTSPLPTSSPVPGDVGGSPSPLPGIPAGGVEILNSEQIDGLPLTIGQILSLQARATDSTGKDNSEQIEWRNAEGSLLGRGSRLEYSAESVKMETLSARVGAAQDRVSFTVSTADIVIAPRVKVIPDSLTEGVEYDEANGILKLPVQDDLPTLKVGDVVIGAATQIPPLKLLSLSQEGNHWRLRVQPALPKELIEKGRATFEQEIDWSGDSGEITLVDIPPQPFHIGDILDPKWSGYVQAGDPIQKGLKVTASASLDWKPTYKGSIEFDKNVGEGVGKIQYHQKGHLSLKMGLRVNGYAWNQKEVVSLISPKKTGILVDIGPVPYNLVISRSENMTLFPEIIYSRNGEIAIQESLDIEESVNCDYYEEYACQNESTASEESKSVNISDGLFGSVFFSVKPQALVCQGDCLVGRWSFFGSAGIIPDRKIEDYFRSEIDANVLKSFLEVSTRSIATMGVRYSSYLSSQENIASSYGLASSASRSASFGIQRQNNTCDPTNPGDKPEKNCNDVFRAVLLGLIQVATNLCNKLPTTTGQLVCYGTTVLPLIILWIWCNANKSGIPNQIVTLVDRNALLDSSNETLSQAYLSGKISSDSVELLSEVTGVTENDSQNMILQFVNENSGINFNSLSSNLSDSLSGLFPGDSTLSDLIEILVRHLS